MKTIDSGKCSRLRYLGARGAEGLLEYTLTMNETLEKLLLVPELFNKKVLLCERKRHIDRGVSSTPSTILSRGVPIPGQGGTPSQDGPGGTPIVGYPPSWPGTSHWDTPWKGHGTSGSIMGWRWDTFLERTWDQWKYYGMEMEMGYPPDQVWTDWKHNLPSRTTYAVGNDVNDFCVKICSLQLDACANLVRYKRDPEYLFEYLEIFSTDYIMFLFISVLDIFILFILTRILLLLLRKTCSLQILLEIIKVTEN